jgi:serine/threonine protein kinase
VPQADEIQELLGRTWAGRYEILEFVGRGGMGLVFKARQIQMDREVALKVVHRRLCTEEKQVQRFQQEARTSSKLNHPNSIRVYDYGTTEDGRLFMAMEFLRGLTLGQLLLREGPQPPERVVHIARQMFKSLAEAHQLGLVHRDLKPENIFICDIYGEHDFVKVLDFGIAKAIGPSADGANLTQTGFICGTPRYLSPEQALGQDVDGRADLYSVGVLMYEMLSGRPPFIGENPISIVMKHVHDDPPPLAGLERHGALGRKLVWLVDRLLEKNAARRPTPADRIVAYLDGLIDESDLMGQSLPAPVRRPLTPDPDVAQRRPTVLAMTAAPASPGGATLNMPPGASAGFKDYAAGGAETTRPVTAMYDAVPPPLPAVPHGPHGPAAGPMTGPGFPAPVSHGAETSLLIPAASPYATGPALPPFAEAGDHQHTAVIARPPSLGVSPASDTLIEQTPGEMTRQMSLDEVRRADRDMRSRAPSQPPTGQIRRREPTGIARRSPPTASVQRAAPAAPRDPVWTWALLGVALSVLLLSGVVWWWSGQPPAGSSTDRLASAPAPVRADAPPSTPAPPAAVEAAAVVAPPAGTLPPPAPVVVAPEAAPELVADALPEPVTGSSVGAALAALALPAELDPALAVPAEPEPVELEADDEQPEPADSADAEDAPEPEPPAPVAAPKPKPKPKPRTSATPRAASKPKPAPAPRPAKPASKPVFDPF